jgi:hypothetical protein
MLRKHTYAPAGLAAATLLLAAGTGLGTALAGESTPRRQDKVAVGIEEVKQLLPLMDQGNDGRVSRQEFMKYMEAEFERLDKDKKGTLDVKDLTRSQGRSSSFAAVGK